MKKLTPIFLLLCSCITDASYDLKTLKGKLEQQQTKKRKEQTVLEEWFAHSNHEKVLTYALQHSPESDIHKKNKSNGYTPLHTACILDKPLHAKLLLQHGANSNTQCSSMKNTPLMDMIKKGNKKMAKLLLEHKASSTIPNRYGVLALMYAIIHSQHDMIQLLLEHEADPTVACSQGNPKNKITTPLIQAIKQKNIRIVQTLLNHGAAKSINQSFLTHDNSQTTALAQAIIADRVDIAELLLQHGATNIGTKIIPIHNPHMQALFYLYTHINVLPFTESESKLYRSYPPSKFCLNPKDEPKDTIPDIYELDAFFSDTSFSPETFAKQHDDYYQYRLQEAMKQPSDQALRIFLFQTIWEKRPGLLDHIRSFFKSTEDCKQVIRNTTKLHSKEQRAAAAMIAHLDHIGDEGPDIMTEYHQGNRQWTIPEHL